MASEFLPHPKPAKKTKRRDPMPQAVVDAVIYRSRYRCECSPECTDRAEVLHHRLMRSQGGGHHVDNLLHVSQRHHLRIHANPATAYERGWLIRSNEGNNR